LNSVKQALAFLDSHRAKIVLILTAIVTYAEAHPLSTQANPSLTRVIATGVAILAQALAAYKYLDGNKAYEVAVVQAAATGGLNETK
jgi:hypothetical protein